MDMSHLPQILAIEQAAYEFPWTESVMSDCLRVGYSAWIVADARDRVLAYALMSMAAGEAHILNICVSPDHRRQGLAQFMLKHLLMTARAGSIDQIFLEVRVSNIAAQQLYFNHGFVTIGQRRAYYPARDGREDALVLSLQQ
ncbi:MAG: ribosomal protein S18-alanine N-acetyltransferase [Pseudomonadota bacterium]|nr:ribosomal protein S18-alanine N-acetyltransferase [Pseudomonadota bacterium]